MKKKTISLKSLSCINVKKRKLCHCSISLFEHGLKCEADEIHHFNSTSFKFLHETRNNEIAKIVFCERLLDSFFETGRGGHFFSYMELRDAFSSTSNGSSRGGFGHFIKNLPETFKRRLYKDVPQKETLGATQILIKRV